MQRAAGQKAIPEGWRLVRLGDVAEVAFSGVDKRTIEGEFPVKLCNYTDVFYNRRIQAGMDFMPATATQSELKRWALKQGDVLFTKDSETADEIGIPAFVADDLTDVLCGYHLGLARPSQATVNGSFLARTLASRTSAQEFGRIANGVTRFGLTLEATRSIPILLPPLREQRAIATVLDSIDGAIEGAEAVIAATEQLRDSLLHLGLGNCSPAASPAGTRNGRKCWGWGGYRRGGRWCGWGRWRKTLQVARERGLSTSVRMELSS